MTKYSISFNEFYHAGGGNYLTICKVSLVDSKRSHQWVEFVVIGCDYLNVYDDNPFRNYQDFDFQAHLLASFELRNYDTAYVMEAFPGLDLFDYCDDYWFYSVDDNGRPIEDTSNLLYNICCYLDKFNRNRTGYID